MIYNGVPIPHPFLRHINLVTGKFFAQDKKSYIASLKSLDIFSQNPQPLDKLTPECYIAVPSLATDSHN